MNDKTPFIFGAVMHILLAVLNLYIAITTSKIPELLYGLAILFLAIAARYVYKIFKK